MKRVIAVILSTTLLGAALTAYACVNAKPGDIASGGCASPTATSCTSDRPVDGSCPTGNDFQSCTVGPHSHTSDAFSYDYSTGANGQCVCTINLDAYQIVTVEDGTPGPNCGG